MDNKIKKHITKVWLNKFPDLQEYTQNKLYKIVGCFVTGLELINLPRSEDYRPHFVIYPLYKNSIKSCFEYPILMHEFFNDKKLQLDIPYNDPKELFKKAQDIVETNIKIKFNSDVPVEDFSSLVDSCLTSDPIYKTHSGRKASLSLIKFYAALYAEHQDEVQNVLAEIKSESANWDMQLFEAWHGKFNLWLNGLKEKASNGGEFLKLIGINKKDSKLSKLRVFDIV